MKLQQKNNRTFFFITSVLLLVSSAVFYWNISSGIQGELDEGLETSTQRVMHQIQTQQTIPEFPPLIEVVRLSNLVTPSRIYRDTSLFDPIEKDQEPFRQLTSVINIDNQVYRITVRTSLWEISDELLALGLSTAVLALAFFIILYWLNHRYSRKLWQPFQQHLSALKNFSLKQQNPIELINSNISEFEELRQVALQLTEKVRADYHNLKEFTENASHEMQTPLAVIRSRIEQFIESEDLSQAQADALHPIYQAVNRLSRMNQNLLLLTKIENRQFTESEMISLNQLIQEQIEWLAELKGARNLEIHLNMPHEVAVFMNPALAEILVKNLLENALRYSCPGDTICITAASPGQIVFANPGKQALAEPERLFERFHRRDSHANSLGLGLAIVKKICESYDFDIHYQYQDDQHQFILSFLKK